MTDLSNLISIMDSFNMDGPQVGIFWYNPGTNSLFGVQKGPAEDFVDSTDSTYPKLHKDFWKKQHFRAVAKNDLHSVFYSDTDYKQIPRGRVWVHPDGSCFVTVGKWIEDYPSAKEVLIDEFNLPEDVEFVYNSHWDIGQGFEL